MTRRGMTLVELLTATLVIAMTGAVVFPLLAAVSDAHATASLTRLRSENARSAMDHVCRLLRAVPAGLDPGEVGITSASDSSALLSDGGGVRLSDGSLELLSDGTWHPLLEDVDAFELRLLAKDGVTDVLASPETTHRVGIRLVADGIELRSAVFCRTRIGNP